MLYSISKLMTSELGSFVLNTHNSENLILISTLGTFVFYEESAGVTSSGESGFPLKHFFTRKLKIFRFISNSYVRLYFLNIK